MNTYKSKFSGSEIDNILTQAKVLCLEIGKTKFEELLEAIENNSPVFIIQPKPNHPSQSILMPVLSYSWNGIFAIINYYVSDWAMCVEKKLMSGENGEVVESNYIPTDRTIKIVIDKFLDPEEGIETKQDRAEDAGFSDWEEYLNWYFNEESGDTGSIKEADTYQHTAAILEWNGEVYDIWINSIKGDSTVKNDLQYILTESHDLSYFKERSLEDDPDNAWCPLVAMLNNDLDISGYNSEKVALDWLVYATYDIESNETERLWFDSLLLSGKDRRDVVAEEYGFENWLDLVDTYVNDPEGQGANYYYYIDETLEWEGNTYYLWECDTVDVDSPRSLMYILTTTIDYNELYSYSLEANPNNSWCPYVAILNKDEDVLYTADTRNDILIKVSEGWGMSSDMYLWFDDFLQHDPPFYSRQDYENWKGELPAYIHENTTEHINQFDYTGLTHKYNGSDYYLWVSTGRYSKIQYILTSTIDPDFLYSHSLNNDQDSEYCPYVATLDENLNVISHEGRNDWLLDTTPLYPIPKKDYQSNNTIRLWLDYFEVSEDENEREELMGEYGYSSWEEFVEFLSTDPLSQPEEREYLGANPYSYTGETLEIFGQTYYIWIFDYLNYGDNPDTVRYLLTSTINYDELSEESLVVNPEIVKSPSLVAIISEDSDEAYIVPEKEFELIVKVDKL